MARGAEIYRKIEEAYSSCNWAEVSRLAKKYKKRNELSEEWEGALEGMAGIWRAVERYNQHISQDARSIKDSGDRLELPRLEPTALKETAGYVNKAGSKEQSGLLSAVQAVLF